MIKFFNWLVLNEAVDVNVINNYALSLLRTGSTDGIHSDDFKTLIDMASRHIKSLPEEARTAAFNEIKSKIFEVTAYVDDDNKISYIINSFNFPPIERLIKITQKVPVSLVEFEDFIEDFISGEIDFYEIKRIIQNNAELYGMINKQDRKRLIVAFAKLFEKTDNEILKRNILEFTEFIGMIHRRSFGN